MPASTIFEFGNVVTLEATFHAEPVQVFVHIRNQASAEATTATVSDIQATPGQPGDFTAFYPVELDVSGEWYYRFTSDVGEIEDAFLVDPDFTRADPVEDLRDVRTLIPRIRRALDGPFEDTPIGAILNDTQAAAIIADAIADVILYTGQNDVFGYQLEVTERDQHYNAPIGWRTDTEMSMAAQSVVVTQAAINYFFQRLKDTKVSETIRDEGGEWSYALSANVLTKQLDLLVKLRDAALESIQGPIFDSYVSFLAVRDAQTAAVIEATTSGIGGLQGDWRFGTIA